MRDLSGKYEGSISKLQMDIERKQISVLIWKNAFISQHNLPVHEALFPSFHKPLKTSSIKFVGLLSDPGGTIPMYD
jgi:hypothetical protein